MRGPALKGGAAAAKSMEWLTRRGSGRSTPKRNGAICGRLSRLWAPTSDWLSKVPVRCQALHGVCRTFRPPR